MTVIRHDPKSQELWQIARALEITELVRSMFVATLRRENPAITEDEIKRRVVGAHYSEEWVRRIWGTTDSGGAKCSLDPTAEGAPPRISAAHASGF